MNVLIIGASRGVGFEVLKLALDYNHLVTALVRYPEKLSVEHDKLRLEKGDILDVGSISRVMKDQDVVCCTIGINPTFKEVTVFSEGIKNLIQEMKKASVKRLICATGIGAGDSKGHGGFLYDKFINPFILGRIYEDKDRQESIIKASDIEWIIVRPGFLTNGKLTKDYKVFIDLKRVTAGKISRKDVAHFIINQFESNEYIRKTPLLTY